MQYDKADQQNCPRRVVFYGRVSTELEAQISALKNQMNWYLELAEHHPNWTVVGQYADEGISGTGMKTRPSFMKMLRDARKKKFDLIVSEELWETCNQIRSKRAAFVKGKDGRAHKFGVSFPQNKWTKILFCDCGMRFHIEGYRVWQKKRG